VSARATDDVFAPVHAAGFPHFGPATMCGRGSPPVEGAYEVTCPDCLAVILTDDGIAKRIEELEAAGVKVDLEAARRAGPE
jgi:hypothetical protein